MIKVLRFEEKYYTEVCKLIKQHKDLLSDDYIKLDTLEDIVKLIERIKETAFVAVDDDNFIGFFFYYDVYGSETKNHSCFIMGAAKRKVNPEKTREAFRKFLTKLYDDYGFVKIQAKSNIYNLASIKILMDSGFKYENFLKGDSSKDGKLLDFAVFGKINPEKLKDKYSPTLREKRAFKIWQKIIHKKIQKYKKER